MICPHARLDANVKASLIEGKRFLAAQAYCIDCTMPFDVSNPQLSVDGRQILVELTPSIEIITDASRCSH
jgi:hypothetical protein